jgi:hypothetical protein
MSPEDLQVGRRVDLARNAPVMPMNRQKDHHQAGDDDQRNPRTLDELRDNDLRPSPRRSIIRQVL